ncbi:UNVERIFIED_ORG: pyridoxamine 5'-phosphate oxidase [Actinomadura viridilutea]
MRGVRLPPMATWKQFEEEAPELAAKIRARFEAAETHVLATLRRDGSPRVSGSEVDFLGPDLAFGSMLNAVKARDLRRDGRCAIHAHPAEGGDAKVAGVAVEVTDPEEKKTYTTGTEPPGDFHAFRLDLTEAVFTSVEDDELVIRFWRPGEPVRTVRRT